MDFKVDINSPAFSQKSHSIFFIKRQSGDTTAGRNKGPMLKSSDLSFLDTNIDLTKDALSGRNLMKIDESQTALVSPTNSSMI